MIKIALMDMRSAGEGPENSADGQRCENGDVVGIVRSSD